jgi:hypothetical protein
MLPGRLVSYRDVATLTLKPCMLGVHGGFPDFIRAHHIIRREASLYEVSTMANKPATLLCWFWGALVSGPAMPPGDAMKKASDGVGSEECHLHLSHPVEACPSAAAASMAYDDAVSRPYLFICMRVPYDYIGYFTVSR